MKKVFLSIACFAGCIAGLSGESDEQVQLGDWGINANIMTMKLDDSSATSTLKTGDIFDDKATGFDISAEYKLTDRVSPIFGYNFASFGGETFVEPGIDAKVDDLDISALYTGVKVKAYEYQGFELFGRGELGFGFTEDVDYGLSAQPGFALLVDPSQKAYSGGTNLYYGIGVGIRKEIWRNFDFSLGYQFRSYGEMDGRGGLIPTDDFDLETSGFDFSVAYRF